MLGQFTGLRMILVVIWVIGGMCVSALGAADPVEVRTQYCIEAKIYRPDPKSLFSANGAPALAVTDLKADVIDLNKGRAPGMTFFGDAEFKVGNVRVVMKGDSLTWNGEANPDPDVIPCLTTPTLKTLSGREAMLQVGEEGIQYFERASDGFFELKTKPGFTGYTFSTTVTPAEKGHANLNWSLETHRVKERMPIPGVALEIGVPVIQTRQLDSTVKVTLGDWGCFVYTAENEALLVFIRVTAVKE